MRFCLVSNGRRSSTWLKSANFYHLNIDKNRLIKIWKKIFSVLYSFRSPHFVCVCSKSSHKLTAKSKYSECGFDLGITPRRCGTGPTVAMFSHSTLYGWHISFWRTRTSTGRVTQPPQQRLAFDIFIVYICCMEIRRRWQRIPATFSRQQWCLCLRVRGTYWFVDEERLGGNGDRERRTGTAARRGRQMMVKRARRWRRKITTG